MDVPGTASVPSADFTLADFTTKAAHWWPNRGAFVEEGEETTYRQLHDRVNRLTAVLRDAGVTAGSRVGMLAANSKAYFEIFFACARLGAVMVPINIRLSPREVAYQIDNADMSHVVLERDLEELADNSRLTSLTHWWLGETYEDAIAAATPDEARVVLPAEAPVSQMYTSGTTGFAKGCVHSQGGWRASALNLAVGLRLDRRPVVLANVPYFHAWGFGFALSHLVTGGTVVVGRQASPAEYWELIDRHQVTSAILPSGAPTQLHPRDHLTVLVGQAGGFRSLLKALLDVVFPKAEYYGIYGMTELTNIALISRLSDELDHPGNLGEPLPGIDAQAHDEAGLPVRPGEVGELVIRGAQVCLGYYKNPEATADLFRDGWLHTGDLVRVGETGSLHFFDRAKDMIKSGGENVYSAEVERVLLECPGVVDVAVFGVADRRWGEAVKALVAFGPGVEADLRAVDDYCLKNLAAYKRPRWYEVVPQIPRSTTGKVVKVRLREQHDPSTSIRLEERT
ncbi:AMP-binding protein [Frankia sp. CNm7]|uniref:AMP-binding protein n=1 Tax=Frankia nepalensis TaxID=1836974 RepID=A0A937RUV0_9ACTN|nr:AMP-binding protein [Frankia nepalensis]MBL7495075.1 AMP-binding protein [Frankia nepalensis]MBL7515323.1 AMP-binding protein [Frankia nepalensis]MBL7522310.1 AMP-binding protein [Frankia nepalensis]MBL7632306.1 AMP-binding protein [Frankia nepalensis]